MLFYKLLFFASALCVDNVPNYFLEMSTSRGRGQEIQRQLSSALVTFCATFKYLRLREGDDEGVLSEPASEQRPTYPSISLTLMFSKLAQGNAARLERTAIRFEKPRRTAPWFEERVSSSGGAHLRHLCPKAGGNGEVLPGHNRSASRPARRS